MTGGIGQLAVGSFVADGTTQVITFNRPGATLAIAVGGFQLRQVGQVGAAVPEPAALAVFGARAGVGGLVARRRRVAAA